MDSHAINLPEINIKYAAPIPAKQLLLAGGGRPPAVNWLQQAAQSRELWCIDHGIDCCYQAGIAPKKLIGDGDSASPAAWQWAEKQGAAIAAFPPEKDYTDTQLALDMAGKTNAFVILTGAMGGRFDHAYSTIFSFGHSQITGCIADEREAVFFLRSHDKIQLQPQNAPKAISLLPLTGEVTEVNITGVHWPLQNAVLRQSMPYAVSNRDEGNHISVSIANGILAVYICWQETII